MTVKSWFCWLFTNEVDLTQWEVRETYFKKLNDLEFGVSRTESLRKYAEDEFKESALGLKEANERIDKLLGLTLVAIGWVGSQQVGTNPTFRPCSITLLLVASILLLCGRWRVTSRMPAAFPDFVRIAKESGKDEDTQFNFDIARQYHKAAYDNGALTWLTQLRLLGAVVFLVVGLTAFACRI